MAVTETKYLSSVETLFRHGRLRPYAKNQLIQYQGDPLTHIHLIKKGYIKAYTILDSGDTRTILILGPGDIFPLAFSESLDWKNYEVRYFYQTLCDCQLVTLSSEVLRDAMDDDPSQLKAYMNYLTASNQAVTHQLEVMKNKKAIDKVAMLLPYLAQKTGKESRPGVYQIQLKLSHQELADLSGITRETTTSLVKELEKSGVIKQQRGRWQINLGALESFQQAG